MTAGAHWCAAALACLLASNTSCSDLPPEAEVVVHVDTDAPLPAGPGEATSSDKPPALFDRIRFEIFKPGKPGDNNTASADDTSDFAVTSGEARSKGLSIGVLPPPGRAGYRVRVQLYRQVFTEIGGPIPPSVPVLEATVALPVVRDGQVTDVNIFLPTDKVGVVQGTPSKPLTAKKGVPGSSKVGTWAGAQRKRCVGSPGAGEVCIPGGAFWMGDPRVPGDPDRSDIPSPRIVVISPFFLDRTEVTVGKFRDWFLARYLVARYGNPPRVDNPAPRLVGQDVSPRRYCNFSGDPHDRNLPLNCISYSLAKEYCQDRDPLHPAYLPTEAQLEYAAGALESRLYVWGSGEPACTDAVFARAPSTGVGLRLFQSDCRQDLLGGSAPATPCYGRDFFGSDSTTEVCDLAGNVAELARDVWSPQKGEKGGCWSQALLEDPVCKDSKSNLHVTRGGSWASQPFELRAAYRAGVPDVFPGDDAWDKPTNLGPLIGFRCARPAKSTTEGTN